MRPGDSPQAMGFALCLGTDNCYIGSVVAQHPTQSKLLASFPSVVAFPPQSSDEKGKSWLHSWLGSSRADSKVPLLERPLVGEEALKLAESKESAGWKIVRGVRR